MSRLRYLPFVHLVNERPLKDKVQQKLPVRTRQHVRRSAAACNFLKAVLVQIAQTG